MTRPVSAKPVPTTPREELPSDLQRYTKTPVATWMKSGPNGPKEAVAGDLAQIKSVWLDANGDEKAVGVRLDAAKLEEAIPAAQKLAEETRHVEELPEDHFVDPMCRTHVAPLAVLHSSDGHFYAAPMDDAPAWSPDGKRSGPMEIDKLGQLGDAPPKPSRDLHSVLGAAPELVAVVDNDRYWKTENQTDAIYPVETEAKTRTQASSRAVSTAQTAHRVRTKI